MPHNNDAKLVRFLYPLIVLTNHATSQKEFVIRSS